MTTFTNSGPDVDAAALEAFEVILGYPLPADYRSFLDTTNGGIPHPNTVPEPSQGFVGVRWFLSLDVDNGEESLSAALEMWQGRYPAGLLPIAVCDGSNLLLMDATDVNQSQIYYWDHDGEADEGDGPRLDNLTRVAHSFSDLLNSLTHWDPRRDPRYAEIAGGSGTGDPDFKPEFD